MAVDLPRPLPPPLVVPPPAHAHRVWAVAWAAIFFVLINIAVLLTFGRANSSSARLPYDVAFEDIREGIERVETDNAETVVVVIGGSIAWGAGHAEEATIAKGLEQFLQRRDGSGKNVSVHNLAMVGARPLDEFLLAWRLRETADLLVMDYNYEFGTDVPQERLWREPETYIRQRQLLSAYGSEFFEDVPAAHACFDRWQIPQVSSRGWLEDHVRPIVENTVPVLRWKHRINRFLFGQHPLTLAERFLRDGGKVVRGELSFLALFDPPAEHLPTTAWEAPGTPEQQAQATQFLTEIFPKDTLRGCLTQAFAASTSRLRIPVIAYLSPQNPGIFAGLHDSPTHAANIRTFTRFFDGTPFVNLDTGTLPASAFIDASHLTASGADMVARLLLPLVQEALR